MCARHETLLWMYQMCLLIPLCLALVCPSATNLQATRDADQAAAVAAAAAEASAAANEAAQQCASEVADAYGGGKEKNGELTQHSLCDVPTHIPTP